MKQRSHCAKVLFQSLRGCGVLLLGGTAFAQSLVNGGVVSGSVPAPGAKDTFTFDANKWDRFEMRLVDVNASSFSPRVEVFDPSGLLIGTATSPHVAVIDTFQVRPGAEGTYTVEVSNAGSAPPPTETYDLHFALAPGANAGGELLDGLVVFGQIDRGELDSYTFRVGSNQTVHGTVTRLNGGTFKLRTENFGPDPTGYSEGIGGVTSQFTTTASPGGIVTLVISDGSRAATGTGRYSIVVHGVLGTPPFPPTVFRPSEFRSDPLLLDDGGDAGLGPRIGNAAEPFNVSLDCTGANSPSVFALWLTTQERPALVTPSGWFYLDGRILLHKFGLHSRSVESWFPEPTGLALPDDPSLVGVGYTVQGICGGGYQGTFARMSGALRQTIGPK